MKSHHRVFISYCHEDVDVETLEFLLHVFDSTSNKDYTILIDRVTLNYGDDIPDFMSLLDHVDAVVLLLTPAYKKRTLQHVGGVHTEFTKILHRYDASRTPKQPKLASHSPDSIVTPRFDLIPVIFTGDQASSLPDEICHLKYLSLVGLRAARDQRGGFLVTDYAKKQFLPEIAKIVGSWRLSTTQNASDFRRSYEDLYTRLFRELKANWSDTTSTNLAMLEELFVKIDAFKQIQKQDVYFLIGRKGSGKSTITDVLLIQFKHEYKGFIPLVANDFGLESLYSLLADPQTNSDTTHVIARRQLFSLAWELLFYICCIEILVGLDKHGELSATQKTNIPTLASFLTSLQYRNAEPLHSQNGVSAHFWYAFGVVIDYVRKVIDDAPADGPQYFAMMKSRLTKQAFLEFALGNSVIACFDKIVDECQKKFLITLDGFDIKFDEFRTNSFVKFPGELKNRATFEMEWLASLLIVILDIKHEKRSSRFYNLLEFCVTVPKDRYLEVQRGVRDGYRFVGRSCSLDWTGIELTILVRKRLEMLSGYETKADASPQERLSEVCRERFAYIPQELAFDYHGHSYRMSLFSYILRHTFWRPRDVLLHYARIIAVADNLRRHRNEMTVDMTRRIVKEVNYEIINNEFVQEFRSIVSNIEEIIQGFSQCRSVLAFQEISQIVARMNFDFVIGEIGVEATEKKIEFLYDVGFLGVYVDEELRDKLGITHKHAFYFNEGQAIKRIGAKDKFATFMFVVHPIFIEYLRLNVSHGELVLQFDWRYLNENEAIRHAKGA